MITIQLPELQTTLRFSLALPERTEPHKSEYALDMDVGTRKDMVKKITHRVYNYLSVFSGVLSVWDPCLQYWEKRLLLLSCLSVCQPIRMVKSAPTERIFINFGVWLTFIVTAHRLWCVHLNFLDTKAHTTVRCSHLNAQYTHVEA